MITNKSDRKKIGIIFSGGPAPSANTVISACALSFFEHNIQCIGFFKGYEFLECFDKKNPNLFHGIHYIKIDHTISQIRNRRGIFLRTSRANPGKQVRAMEDFKNPEKIAQLRNIIDALEHLNIGTLISIGGDDTLKTANFLKILGINVIHIPKTIDNDYFGIPWTFGFWTCVDVAKSMILNLRADAMATDSFVIAEMMGRKSGWITYAAGIAGESIKMISNEDINVKYLDLDDLGTELANLIISRQKMMRPYGVICVSEGLVEKLPDKMLPKEKDKHGNLQLTQVQIGRKIRDITRTKYKEITGRDIKIIYKQVGYETRAAQPISFDVVLGSMLGHGAYKLYANKQFGHMVSVSDNFDILAIPFEELIDPETLLTKVRLVPKGSDFYNLKETLAFREFEDLY
ncbi:MAG: 6-phosphofructokinase [Bacteroidetes bacterium]|nr:6-phosphofructokinase [Bacteroidota bacterium]